MARRAGSQRSGAPFGATALTQRKIIARLSLSAGDGIHTRKFGVVICRDTTIPAKIVRMKKSVAVAVGLVGMVPSVVFAGNADLKYCIALSEMYVHFLGDPRMEPGTVDAEASVAMAMCRQGDMASSIAVLEKKLLDAKVSLPKHGVPGG